MVLLRGCTAAATAGAVGQRAPRSRPAGRRLSRDDVIPVAVLPHLLSLAVAAIPVLLAAAAAHCQGAAHAIAGTRARACCKAHTRAAGACATVASRARAAAKLRLRLLRRRRA